VAGTFTEVEPGRRVVFTWGREGSADLPPGASTVIITLEPPAGGTLVHAWDFAQATGQRVVVSDEVAQHVVTGRAVLSTPFTDEGNQTMPERTSYTQGTPNWVDLQTSDQDAAKAFYAGLFGWTYDDQPMPQGPVYSMALLGGHTVAAIAPQSPEMAAAGVPPMWNTYIAVDSVDEAVGKVEAAGGKVAMAPFDIMDAGRMAFVMDPAGAPVALWQANQHIGATLVNEPGTLTWNELITADPAAVRFYTDVLGLTTSTMDMGEGQQYTLFEAGGQQVGGSMAPPMPGIPNHWQVYFAVADTDAAAARATELGGTIQAPPFDTPVGRMAVIGDPQGAVFSIIKLADQPAQ